jgi:small conductance mechanosensitive channel
MAIAKKVKEPVTCSCEEYNRKKKRQRAAKVVWLCAIAAFFVLFFTFGFIAKYIFGPDSEYTKAAQENIIQIINIFNFFENKLPEIFKSLSSLVIVFVIIFLLNIILKIVSTGSNRRKTVCNLISSFLKYTGFIIAAMVLLSVWGVDTTTLLASVGVLGIVIGLGAQSLVSDILSGLFMILENSCQVGDIITIDGFRGEVINVGIRTTQIKDVGGDIKITNNSTIKSFINMSKHRSAAICDVTVEYDASIENVEKVIKDNLANIGNKIPAITEGPTYSGPVQFNECGVVLRIIAKCDETRRIQTVRELNREIKLLFDKHKIKIAIPQIQVNNKK